MRATSIEETGPPSVLPICERVDPPSGPDEAPVRAEAARGNRADAPMKRERSRRAPPRPLPLALGLATAMAIATLGCPSEPAPLDPGAASEADGPAAEAETQAQQENEAEQGSALAGGLDEAAEEALGRHMANRYPATLAGVIEKRFLRVLTSRNGFDYFLHDGRRGGYQYEMVRDFTRFLNERHLEGDETLPIQFELIPVDDDQLIPLLLDGAGDLIAARLTITPRRAARVAFSRPYRRVDERLVAHDRSPRVESLEDLSGRPVAVRASSSFAESLASLSARLRESGRAPVDVAFVDEDLETERILALVAARRFEYSVADSLVAELATEIHPTLRVPEDLALRTDGELAWATIPSANALLDEMNAFLPTFRQGTLRGNIALRRYCEAERGALRRLSEGEAGAPKHVSDFDDLFRSHAAEFDLDWRLVAAMAYQESRFDPRARNRWGAVGLMQIKPKTAAEPYVDIPEIEGIENASDNVRAALKYLDWIKRRYFDAEPDLRERDRLRMALAAYNAGPRTILRARARARERGLDANRWFRNVELALLEMRRTEPVRYVSEINQRYLSYVMLGLE